LGGGGVVKKIFVPFVRVHEVKVNYGNLSSFMFWGFFKQIYSIQFSVMWYI